MRRLLSLFLLLAIVPGVLVRNPPLPFNRIEPLRITALPLPDERTQARQLGAFRLIGLWQLQTRHHMFGGYSALLALDGGEFLAVGDGADWLRFFEPGTGPARYSFGHLPLGTSRDKHFRDSESATRDPASGAMWFGWEGTNSISRTDAAMVLQGRVHPPAMAGWPENRGAESLARLADGRFVAVSESFGEDWTRHPAVLFPGDPLAGHAGQPITFIGPDGYRPTDMAQLPDGRVLVLMRQLLWPVPMRLSLRIALADPAELASGKPWQATEVARLDYPLPIDNFEGMAVRAGRDGKPEVWLISDENASQFQRTLLWKLSLDPARLPRTSKGARR